MHDLRPRRIEGVPGKNIRPLLGVPLIGWSVSQAKKSGLFERVAVSSDDPSILRVARQFGADLVIERPGELATDTISKLPAIKHALLEAEREVGHRFDILVELDATSPLRDIEDIAGAVAQLEREGRSAVITAAPARRSPYFNLVERAEDGSVRVSKTTTPPVSRRQDAPPCFDMNASIYVWARDVFVGEPQVFYADTGLFEMPEERSIDIDSELDFAIVEQIARSRRQRSESPGVWPRFDLSGRVALVTGGTGILGRHFCAALAEAGARIAILDRIEAEVTKLAAELQDRFLNPCLGLAVDLTGGAGLRAAVERVEAELGPVDILHNNAATKGANLAKFFTSVEDYDEETWREIMAVNLDAMFFVAREVGVRMAERGRGSIIQTASIYGVLGPDQRIYAGSQFLGRPINTPPVYSASKAGVIGLTRFLATYWGDRGVRVNTLTPGGVGSGQNETFDRNYSARVPLGRMAQPEEMAAALLFLASDASSYITGHNLIVDGGLSAW